MEGGSTHEGWFMGSAFLKVVAGALALGCLAITAGCAQTSTNSGASIQPPGCRQETAETFVLTGKIDAGMAACVAERFEPGMREIILNSMGGDVASALDIASHFEGRRLTMRVREECNSSCANYFLPLAGRIVVEPGALIILHGSIDPWTASRVQARSRAAFMRTQLAAGVGRPEAQALFETGAEKLSALVARQAAFASRNGIPPGWLMYREQGSDGRDIPGLSEDLRPRTRYLLVEERMLRACLPGVEIEPYQADLRRHWLRSIRRLGLAWSAIVPSGAMVCTGPD